MQIKILNEQPFQILSTNFTIGSSETGYTLYFSADGVDFSPLFTVAPNTERMVTEVANGAYYKLVGNEGELIVNWQKECHSGGGGGGEYVLPTASSTRLGGIVVGNGLSITDDGVLSAQGGGGEIPIATTTSLGTVIVGTGLSIDTDGVLSAQGGEIPIATTTSLGTVIVGTGLSIDTDGVLSATGGGGGAEVVYIDAMTEEKAAAEFTYILNCFHNNTPIQKTYKMKDEDKEITASVIQNYGDGYEIRLIGIKPGDNGLDNIIVMKIEPSGRHYINYWAVEKGGYGVVSAKALPIDANGDFYGWVNFYELKRAAGEPSEFRNYAFEPFGLQYKGQAPWGDEVVLAAGQITNIERKITPNEEEGGWFDDSYLYGEIYIDGVLHEGCWKIDYSSGEKIYFRPKSTGGDTSAISAALDEIIG